MKQKFIALGLGLFFLPALVFAQGGGTGTLTNLIDTLEGIVSDLIPILIGVLFLVFIYGLILFVFKAGDEEAKKKGKQVMIGGIIAIFIVVGIWGIVYWLGEVFGIQGQLGGELPTPGIDDLP